MLKSGQLLHQVHAVRGIQEIQIFTAASTSLILQAASDICHNIFYSCSKNLTRKNQRHTPNKNQRCPFPCKKVNQELNQFRRNMRKPYLAHTIWKIGRYRDDSKNVLFGDSVADTVESFLVEENQTKSC